MKYKIRADGYKKLMYNHYKKRLLPISGRIEGFSISQQFAKFTADKLPTDWTLI
jgi:hypothetical protein